MDVNNTRLQQYIAYWKSAQTNAFVELGITQVGTPEFSAKGEYVNLEDADQFFGRIASQKVGFGVMTKITFKEVSYADLFARILQGQMAQIVDGVKFAYDGDTVPVNMNRDVAGELRLVPLGAAAGDLSECITLWKAAPQLDLKLAGDRTKYQTVDAEFIAYPDPTRARAGYPLSASYFRLGDPTAIPADPDYIFAVFGDAPVSPYLHTPGFTIAPGDKKKSFWYGAYKAAQAGSTLVANGAISATATALVYDGKSVPGESYTGKFIELPTGETVYCTLDTQATNVTGTATIVRAALGSTAAAIADNDVAQMLDSNSIAILPVTDRAQMASSVPGAATVGNSSSTGSLVFGDKGLITHVSGPSTTNVTATIGATVSKNLAVATQ
ncbi:MAG: hypothetical protein IPJ01_12030 [Micavibrio sp.]|nr:hypothetical protein [Micavibrio sp.]